VIADELRGKGVSSEIIEIVTSEIDQDVEYAIALDLALRKHRPIAHLESEIVRRRIHGALARRGFSMSIISTVMHEIGI
jgi:regulatory protein